MTVDTEKTGQEVTLPDFTAKTAATGEEIFQQAVANAQPESPEAPQVEASTPSEEPSEAPVVEEKPAEAPPEEPSTEAPSDDSSTEEDTAEDSGEEKTFDAAYVKELRDESARYRKRASTAEAERDAARSDALRYEVAFAHGLTAEDIPFLKGTKEEMEALASRLKASAQAPPAQPAGTPQDPRVGFGIPSGALTSTSGNSEADMLREFMGL